MKERFQLNPDILSQNSRETISIVESKGHVLYIRYLLTKRFGLRGLEMELKKMGLSAPSIDSLIAYFNEIIWPAAEKFGVASLYADYRNKINHLDKFKTYNFSRNILRYRVEMDDKLDLQPKLMKFFYYLDIDSMWITELYKYYKTVGNFPLDTDGTKILDTSFLAASNAARSVEKIIQCPKRYLIDQMILQDVSARRIAEYAKRNLNLNIIEHEVMMYKKVFFNIRSASLAEQIEKMTQEKNWLEQELSSLGSSHTVEYQSMEPGDRVAMQRTLQQRLQEVEHTIFTLNARHNEAISLLATDQFMDTKQMLLNMTNIAYSKFVEVSQCTDRDAIKPMLDLTRMVTMASDRLEKEEGQMGKNTAAINGADPYAQRELLKLCNAQISEMKVPNGPLGDLDNMGIGMDDIDGIDELGINFKDENDMTE